jgi:hypothetical protein
MMVMEAVSETLDISSIFTWLIAQEDFIAYRHTESFGACKDELQQFNSQNGSVKTKFT